MATYAQLNSSLRAQGQSALRSFDRTMLLQVNSYVNMYGYDNVYGGRMRIRWHNTAWGNYYHRFEFVNANDSYLNNYLNSGIETGKLMYSSHVENSIYQCVKRCMDLVESRISDRNVYFRVCHQSCHGSCHTSRGRR